MRFSPILIFHICSGIAGFLAGAAAISFRKGSRRHALAGNVFVISMMSLAVSGIYLAVVKHEPGNILGGALTFYLVATSWMTAKRRDKETGLLDWGALLVALALAAVTATLGFEAATSPTGLKFQYPAGPYFLLGSVALLSAVGDVRMLVLGGISGTPRIARHLWRMCFAFFIASASIFLARQQLFPAVLRKTGALVLLSFLPLILMIFWLVRIRFANGYTKMVAASSAATLRTNMEATAIATSLKQEPAP
jgi:hypothetical protein